MEISRHNELLAAFAQMQCRLLALTDDVATLKAELAARDASLHSLQLAHTQLQTVVSLQDEHIASLTRELFGKSSEKAKRSQLIDQRSGNGTVIHDPGIGRVKSLQANGIRFEIGDLSTADAPQAGHRVGDATGL